MRHQFPRPAGSGLAIVLAGLTFVVVIVSGLFLLYQPGVSPQPPPFDLPRAPVTMQLHGAKAPHPDHSRAKAQRLARIQRFHHRAPA